MLLRQRNVLSYRVVLVIDIQKPTNTVLSDQQFQTGCQDYCWYLQGALAGGTVFQVFAVIKFQLKLKKSMQQILRLLQLNLLEKRDLMAFLRGDSPIDRKTAINQIALL